MVRNPRVHSSSVLRPYNTDFSTPTTTARTVRAKRHSNFGTLRCPPSTPTISFGVASERSSSTKFRPRPCLFQTLATIAAIYTSGWWIPRSGALGTVAVSTCRRQSCGTSSLLALAHPRSASHWHYRQQQQNNHCETRPFYSPSPATPRRQHSSSRSSKSMALFATQRDRSGTITVSPKQESEQSALVVIAHGLGDTAEGFADVAEFLAKAMPHVKFILPTAPTQPVTMNGGMPMPSWYDITGLDERSNENCAGLEASVARLEQILQTEHDATGLSYNRMVLAGFSQGGALSLFAGLQQQPQRGLAGVVCLSGYLPAAKKFRIAPGCEGTPVFHGHGQQDMLVPFAMGKKSADTVQTEHGATNYTLKAYPKLGHTVDQTELQDVLTFLQSILPVDAQFNIKVKDAQEMSVKELREAIRKAGIGSKAVGLMEKPEFVRLLQDHRDGKL